jgi:hypothetical protein
LLTGLAAVTPNATSLRLEPLRHIPGLGVVLVLGRPVGDRRAGAERGRPLVAQAVGLDMFAHIPVVKSGLQTDVKKVCDTLFSSNWQRVSHGRCWCSSRVAGAWTIAFPDRRAPVARWPWHLPGPDSDQRVRAHHAPQPDRRALC